MSEIIIDVPEGFVARHNPDGTISIVPGTKPMGPEAAVHYTGTVNWWYESYTPHGQDKEWSGVEGYAVGQDRAHHRPTEGPTVRNVRMRQIVSVSIFGDTEEEVSDGLDKILVAVDRINGRD